MFLEFFSNFSPTTTTTKKTLPHLSVLELNNIPLTVDPWRDKNHHLTYKNRFCGEIDFIDLLNDFLTTLDSFYSIDHRQRQLFHWIDWCLALFRHNSWIRHDSTRFDTIRPTTKKINDLPGWLRSWYSRWIQFIPFANEKKTISANHKPHKFVVKPNRLLRKLRNSRHSTPKKKINIKNVRKMDTLEQKKNESNISGTKQKIIRQANMWLYVYRARWQRTGTRPRGHLGRRFDQERPEEPGWTGGSHWRWHGVHHTRRPQVEEQKNQNADE